MRVQDPNHEQFQPPGLGLPADVTAGRLLKRRSLLHQLDKSWVAAKEDVVRSSVALEERALNLLTSTEVRNAFELKNEPDPVRDRYGRNPHGQSLLMARRLFEAGVPVVTVNWHNDSNPFWDTHGDNFNKLKNNLMPISDQGFSAVLEDLQSRGMLKDTLIVWVGEFGRRPHISANNAGREHWPFCFSAVMAGGGIRGGQLYGSSDRNGAYPAEAPVKPDDLMATVFHGLGIDHEQEIIGREGVPRTLTKGTPITTLFG